jgi:hypothetical protein
VTKELVYESDWLASTPFFYNPRTGAAGTDIWSVIPRDDIRFHGEGLYNFLDFGYSVFDQTPLADVRFLRHSTRLWRGTDGQLTVETLDDPVDHWRDYRLSEADVIDLIRARVQAWEASLPADQEIVLPLSGGFDSRLLLWCLQDKARVRAYTYGISEDQDRSTEVVYARTLAQRFGVRWGRIPLGDFHRYFADWDRHFGIATHAHGMYHFEFYTKIRERLAGPRAFLSGIFGDVWAGSIPPQQIDCPADLIRLGYTHGVRADPARMRLTVEHGQRDSFWSEHRERLDDHRFQVITTVRLKLMLISYLMRVPRLFDFQPWTPYLDIDIAMAMLNLPQDRRTNRQWQRDFFAKVGLDLENQGLVSSGQNTLDLQAIYRMPLPPLDAKRLGDLIAPEYVAWINRQLPGSFGLWRDDRVDALLRVRKVGGALHRLGVRNRGASRLSAYNAYLVLLPLQRLLEQRTPA